MKRIILAVTLALAAAIAHAQQLSICQTYNGGQIVVRGQCPQGTFFVGYY